MAIHIDTIKIGAFRGIKNLEINDLGDINILVGDNTSGKTSLLEAIQILSRPLDFNNIVIISRQRDRYRLLPAQSQYNSFFNIFPNPDNIFAKKDALLSISLGARLHDTEYTLNLSGNVRKSSLSIEELEYAKNILHSSLAPVDEEVRTYIGSLDVANMPNATDMNTNISVSLNKYTRVLRSNNSPMLFECEFLSTIDHIITENFRPIIKSKERTKELVKLLQKAFDKNILDLRLIEDADGRMYQAVDHEQLGYVPLPIFGDGIKKVIAMASAAAVVKNGLLLIEEYEAAIHPNAMSIVFKFLLDVSKKRNLQLFLTTHNLKALEALLDCSHDLSRIRVITMQNSAEQTLAKVLAGEDAKAALKLG